MKKSKCALLLTTALFCSYGFATKNSTSTESSTCQTTCQTTTRTPTERELRTHTDELRALLSGLQNFPQDRVESFLEMTFEVFRRLSNGFSQDDMRRIYGRSISLADLRAAPAILFGQTHNDREGILNNYVLSHMIYTPRSVVLLERYTQDDSIRLLGWLLCKIAYLDYLRDNPSVDFHRGQPMLNQLAHGADHLVQHLANIRFPFPFINEIASGWDVAGSGDLFRRLPSLAAAVNQMHSNGNQALVHLGLTHSPTTAREFLTRTMGPLVAFVRALSMPTLAAITTLETSLPAGYLEISPLSSLVLQPEANPNPPTCARCNRPAPKICGSCHNVRYCGIECQRAHWPEHKKGCKQS